MYLNKATIIGNLTRDPELKNLPSGTSVCNFSVATNRVWKNKEGEKMEEVQFHNIVVFGHMANSTAKYMSKGAHILIEGRLQTQSWDDATSGKKMYRTEIVADRIQFGRKSTGAAPNQAATPSNIAGGYKGSNPDISRPAASQEDKELDDEMNRMTAPLGDKIEYPEEDINPDDIPF